MSINKASVHAGTCRKLSKIYMSSDLSHLTASGLHPIFIHTIRTEFKVRNIHILRHDCKSLVVVDTSGVPIFNVPYKSFGQIHNSRIELDPLMLD